jgi:hypothetical protein
LLTGTTSLKKAAIFESLKKLNFKQTNDMKKLALSFGVMLMSVFAVNTAKAQTPAGPVIAFDKEVHDYGTIKQGDNGECEFKFTNTGNEPLIITNAVGSCGCTVPEWPKNPIKPGESASIKVKYDTKRVGAINKSVTVSSNSATEPTKTLRIRGMVEAVEGGGAPVRTDGNGVPGGGN